MAPLLGEFAHDWAALGPIWVGGEPVARVLRLERMARAEGP
jgi:hypothetical protein